MPDATESMLGIIPPLFIAGGSLLLLDRFVNKPSGKRRLPFDKQERKDNKGRGRGLGFGDFSNIGW